MYLYGWDQLIIQSSIGTYENFRRQSFGLRFATANTGDRFGNTLILLIITISITTKQQYKQNTNDDAVLLVGSHGSYIYSLPPSYSKLERQRPRALWYPLKNYITHPNTRLSIRLDGFYAERSVPLDTGTLRYICLATIYFGETNKY